jgi:prepilin-type N-terminal cleavage/methylation domain-containing protein
MRLAGLAASLQSRGYRSCNQLYDNELIQTPPGARSLLLCGTVPPVLSPATVVVWSTFMELSHRTEASRGIVAKGLAVGIRGFTLIELMIVVTLIGLITMIALPRFSGAREKAHRAQAITDLRTLVSAQEAYWADNRAYADDIALLTEFNHTPEVVITILETTGNGWSAEVTHNSNADIKCGFYTGPVTPPVVAGIKEGRIECEG